MSPDENFWSTHTQHNWLRGWNLIPNFLHKSALSTTEYLGNRSDNWIIDHYWPIYGFFRKRETKHSEMLNRAYKELEKLNIREDDKYYVTLNAIKKFQDISYFHQAIQHMRSYQELFESWNNLDKLQKQFNSLLEELEPILRNRIRTKASEKENYPHHIAIFEKPDTASKNLDYYNMNSLMNDVYDYLYYDEQWVYC